MFERNVRHPLPCLIVVLFGIMRLCYAAEPCSQLTAADQARLQSYLRLRFGIDNNVRLEIAEDRVVSDSCYLGLTIKGTSSIKQWDLTLYLSPDRRFLTSDLFDTQLDPALDRTDKASSLMHSLTAGKPPGIGRQDAWVTIVEFADFECTYCKRFDEMLKEVLSKQGDRVRLVFRHLPLSVHPWARKAAEGAACAGFDSDGAFWFLHDRLFEDQASITPENLPAKLLQYAERAPGVNLSKYRSCIEQDMALGVVLRDINLASAHAVSGTPTIFINGQRLDGLITAAEMRKLIDEAARPSIVRQPGPIPPN